MIWSSDKGWGGVGRVRQGEDGAEGGVDAAVFRKLRASKQFCRNCARRTEPSFDAPSMAQKDFGGRPVRQFLGFGKTAKKL